MNFYKRCATVALWILAVVGTVSGLVGLLTATQVIKPLIVISGSMEPEIMTGDLLIATKAEASTLKVGDVVSLPSELTDNLVTHRIRSIEPAGDGGYTVVMKGDNNDFEDMLDYSVSGAVWKPDMRVPGFGTVLMRMTSPATALPLLAGLVALLALTMLPNVITVASRRPEGPSHRRSRSEEATA